MATAIDHELNDVYLFGVSGLSDDGLRLVIEILPIAFDQSVQRCSGSSALNKFSRLICQHFAWLP